MPVESRKAKFADKAGMHQKLTDNARYSYFSLNLIFTVNSASYCVGPT